MFCATCGQAVPEGATICGNCGTSSAAKTADPAAPAASPDVNAVLAPPAYAGGPSAHAGARTLANRIIERAKAILLTPRTEWPVIAGEATTAQDIYLRYVAPLVGVGVLASLIGGVLIGIPIPLLGTVRLGLGAALGGAILHFVLTFVAVFVVAMIVDALAPTFGGRKDALGALKVTAYSFTPAWLATILTIVPALGFVAGVIGLYGLYLMYLGLPVLMRTPEDKALGYTVVVVLCAIVLNIAVAALTGLVTGGYGAHV
jgi:hypothetical protein